MILNNCSTSGNTLRSLAWNHLPLWYVSNSSFNIKWVEITTRARDECYTIVAIDCARRIRQQEASIRALIQDLARVIAEDDQESPKSWNTVTNKVQTICMHRRLSTKMPPTCVFGDHLSRTKDQFRTSSQSRNVDNGHNNKQPKTSAPDKKRGGPPNKGRQNPQTNKTKLQHQLRKLAFVVKKTAGKVNSRTLGLLFKETHVYAFRDPKILKTYWCPQDWNTLEQKQSRW